MPTIDDLFERAATLEGPDAGVTTGETFTSYAEIYERSKKLATGLSDLGVNKGDRVSFWLHNSIEYLVTFAACARLGAIVVAVNTKFRAAEVADIVGRTGSKALLLCSNHGGFDYLNEFQSIDRGNFPDLRHLIFCSDDISDLPSTGYSHTPYSELLLNEAMEASAAAPADISNIFTTSGTTSKPKFAAHSHNGVYGHGVDVDRAFGLSEPDAVSLQIMPFCGVFGFSQVIGALHAAVPMVMPEGFDADETADLINIHGITHATGSDDMFYRVLNAGKSSTGLDQPFPSLRRCAFASFNSYLLSFPREAEKAGMTMIAPYGMSEVYALFALRRMDQDGEDRHRSGGTLVNPDARVRVRSPDTGEILPDGEAGELELTSPNLMVGYYGNDEATKAAITDDGYIRTGDLGYSEGSQAFTYLGRMNDVLRLGGYLVNPEEIENCLLELDAISDAQVVEVGLEKGNRPVAFVILTDGAVLDEAGAIAHCQAGLAKFKCPVRVIEVAEFPVTTGANGTKIQKAKLREMASLALNS